MCRPGRDDTWVVIVSSCSQSFEPALGAEKRSMLVTPVVNEFRVDGVYRYRVK